MAEGLGSHNKTSFPYDHSGISSYGFFSFFLFLTFSGFLCQFLIFGTGFLVNFPPSVFFPIINHFEVPLDSQSFSSARTLSPCRATWIGMNNHSSVDFSCIFCPDLWTDPCPLLDAKKQVFSWSSTPPVLHFPRPKQGCGMLCLGYTQDVCPGEDFRAEHSHVFSWVGFYLF